MEQSEIPSGVAVLGSDGARMAGTGEMSRAGGDWEGDLSLTYERIR